MESSFCERNLMDCFQLLTTEDAIIISMPETQVHSWNQVNRIQSWPGCILTIEVTRSLILEKLERYVQWIFLSQSFNCLDMLCVADPIKYEPYQLQFSAPTSNNHHTDPPSALPSGGRQVFAAPRAAAPSPSGPVCVQNRRLHQLKHWIFIVIPVV